MAVPRASHKQLTPAPLVPPACSCDKKLLELGWQETTPWEEGLRKTIDWYLKHANRDYWCVRGGREGVCILALSNLAASMPVASFEHPPL